MQELNQIVSSSTARRNINWYRINLQIAIIATVHHLRYFNRSLSSKRPPYDFWHDLRCICSSANPACECHRARTACPVSLAKTAVARVWSSLGLKRYSALH